MLHYQCDPDIRVAIYLAGAVLAISAFVVALAAYGTASIPNTSARLCELTEPIVIDGTEYPASDDDFSVFLPCKFLHLEQDV